MNVIKYLLEEITDLYIRVHGESPDKAVLTHWEGESETYLLDKKYELISELGH
jgi:hypothetical protein